MLLTSMVLTSTNVLWISLYNEPLTTLTSRALGGLASNRRTLQRAAGRCHESIASYQKSNSVNRCPLARGTHLPNLSSIRFETTELLYRASPQHQQQDE